MLVKGWWRALEKWYNITIFEFDSVLGVIAYSFTARGHDLKRIGLNLTSTPNNENSMENSTK
jgi:hypothetical protein